MQSVSVFAPASVANVSCGYDVLGLALEKPGDNVTMHLNGSRKITLDKIEVMRDACHAIRKKIL